MGAQLQVQKPSGQNMLEKRLWIHSKKRSYIIEEG